MSSCILYLSMWPCQSIWILWMLHSLTLKMEKPIRMTWCIHISSVVRFRTINNFTKNNNRFYACFQQNLYRKIYLLKSWNRIESFLLLNKINELIKNWILSIKIKEQEMDLNVTWCFAQHFIDRRLQQFREIKL